jgi:hypothetical protein
MSSEGLRSLATNFKKIIELASKKRTIFHKRVNRWDEMVNKIAPFLPEFLVEKLRTHIQNK